MEISNNSSQENTVPMTRAAAFGLRYWRWLTRTERSRPRPDLADAWNGEPIWLAAKPENARYIESLG